MFGIHLKPGKSHVVWNVKPQPVNLTLLPSVIFEPCHKKTCLQGFGPGKTRTDLLSYRGYM